MRASEALERHRQEIRRLVIVRKAEDLAIPVLLHFNPKADLDSLHF